MADGIVGSKIKRMAPQSLFSVLIGIPFAFAQRRERRAGVGW